ncbi:MAG: deoxyribodipyrimidine photo-lyase, partial [Spirosomaceae bacterium]|nr:deoxyribodipyrimidine photo-lyase [Spirosomataceae bacterium]
MDKTVALYWLKKDIRLNDNTAFLTALRQHSTVVPIFILEETYLSAPETSIVHVNAQFQALLDFKEKLTAEGVEPLYLYGEAVHILQKLFDLHKFAYIYSHEEIGNGLTYKRDRAVAKFCHENGISWREMQQTGVVRRLKNRDDWANLWKDFYGRYSESAPSSAQLRKVKILPAWENLTERFEPLIEKIFDDKAVEELSQLSLQHVSETNAHADLYDFMHNRGVKYRGGISSPNTALTAGSRLSVHLAFGTISGRYVYQKVNERIA